MEGGLDINSQHMWRGIMVVLALIALVMLILFGIDAGFKFNGKKKVVPNISKWASVALSASSILVVPVLAYIYKKKGTIEGLAVVD
jgi:hypothetical protein